MASLRDIRKRIRSVKNTQQITKAMKMVAAAKLRKAQDAIIAARPYAQMFDRIIAALAARSESVAHPLMEAREPLLAEVIVLTSDRGLAGGFNSNVIRRVNRFIAEKEKGFQKVRLITIGRKGYDFFKKRNVELARDMQGVYSRMNYATAKEISGELSARFLAREIGGAFVVYNEFVSVINQRVTVAQLLPLNSVASPPDPKAGSVDFKYEPSRQAVLDQLIPQALTVKFYRTLLESVASEHGARMSAMESATNNASDMIDSLTLYYNRTRQAVITKELMEIVSGAEALKS